MRARALCQLYLFLSSRVVEETKTLSYIFYKVQYPDMPHTTHSLPRCRSLARSLATIY
jgi:hypothetical protein